MLIFPKLPTLLLNNRGFPGYICMLLLKPESLVILHNCSVKKS